MKTTYGIFYGTKDDARREGRRLANLHKHDISIFVCGIQRYSFEEYDPADENDLLSFVEKIPYTP